MWTRVGDFSRTHWRRRRFVAWRHFDELLGCVVSSRIVVEFGRIVSQVNTHRLTMGRSDMTSYFQYGGHDGMSLPSDQCP